MLATKIKMKPGCGTSNNFLEIDSIYLTGLPDEDFYKKEIIHNYLIENPGEKYVRSESNNLTQDNLLRLPRV